MSQRDAATSEDRPATGTGVPVDQETLADIAWREDRVGLWELLQKAPNGRGSMSVEDAAELAYKMGFLKAKEQG